MASSLQKQNRRRDLERRAQSYAVSMLMDCQDVLQFIGAQSLGHVAEFL